MLSQSQKTQQTFGIQGAQSLPIVKTILTVDGRVLLFSNLFNPAESDEIFRELLNTTQWRQDSIKIYGKSVLLPRKTAWYGDEDKTYAYSGIEMHPQPWTAVLETVKSRIEPFTDVTFNSVLLNLYRNGQDSVSWHADDEPELGQNPVIASVSFGANRQFVLKHKWRKDLDKIAIDLTHGSFLLMEGATQHNWLHQVPKTKKNVSERINLTFRVIY